MLARTPIMALHRLTSIMILGLLNQKLIKGKRVEKSNFTRRQVVKKRQLLEETREVLCSVSKWDKDVVVKEAVHIMAIE
jgi:hypothetical protein